MNLRPTGYSGTMRARYYIIALVLLLALDVWAWGNVWAVMS
jgi:hypothetical protein